VLNPIQVIRFAADFDKFNVPGRIDERNLDFATDVLNALDWIMIQNQLNCVGVVIIDPVRNLLFLTPRIGWRIFSQQIEVFFQLFLVALESFIIN